MKIGLNKIILKSIFLVTSLLGACAQTQQIKTFDGQNATSVDCSGVLGNWSMCYEKIGNICGAYGYEIVSSTLDGNVIRRKESDQRVIIARCKN
jgi:hypothetical protein